MLSFGGTVKQTIKSLLNVSFPSSTTFTFLEEIGRGGMGVVYLAQRQSEGVSDLVVLKTLKIPSEERVDRLKKEANIAAALRHENIVRTYGLESITGSLEEPSAPTGQKSLTIGSETQMLLNSRPELLDILRNGNSIEDFTCDTTFLERSFSPSEKKIYLMVMEYVEGRDLSNLFQILLNQGLLMPLEISAFIISRICRALDYAHKYIVHRDISPENVLINNQGVAFLSDFGIAVAAGQEVHSIAGKVQYMAPEQINCDHVDNRSDIFALGLVAYEAATGINPLCPPYHFPLEGRIEYVRNRVKNKILPPAEVCRDIPKVYSDIISKMLCQNPADRYQNIGDVLNDIEKEYLYKDGFGPTNNSLAAFVQLAADKFPEPDNFQKEQLCFLSHDSQHFNFSRKISKELFLKAGLELTRELHHLPVSYLVKFM